MLRDSPNEAAGQQVRSCIASIDEADHQPALSMVQGVLSCYRASMVGAGSRQDPIELLAWCGCGYTTLI